MTIKLSNNKGKKIKCKFCKELNFFMEDEIILENNERFLICEHCGKKIKLKRL